MDNMPDKPLQFKKLHETAIIPAYQTSGAAGFDFNASILLNDEESFNHIDKTTDGDTPCVVIAPKTQFVVKTKLACAIPFGFEMQIRPRSGLAFKHCITLTNTPGTIDSDYRGEIMIMVYNLGCKPFTIYQHDRIAQGVISRVPQLNIIEVDQLADTERGAGGFGSTGV
jgi:dUTP pyrophosphatase